MFFTNLDFLISIIREQNIYVQTECFNDNAENRYWNKNITYTSEYKTHILIHRHILTYNQSHLFSEIKNELRSCNMESDLELSNTVMEKVKIHNEKSK